jgi:hypothetical protein
MQIGEALHQLDAHYVFRYLVAVLPFEAQPQRRTVGNGRRLDFKPDEQPTLDHHFFSTRRLLERDGFAFAHPSLPSSLFGRTIQTCGRNPTRGAVPDVLAVLPTLIPISPHALLLAADPRLRNQDAQNRAEAVAAVLANLPILIS